MLNAKQYLIRILIDHIIRLFDENNLEKLILEEG